MSALTLRTIGRRPTLWVEVGVAAAWIALASMSGEVRADSPAASGPLWPGGSLWICIPGMDGASSHAGISAGGVAWPDGAVLAASLPMWSLMAVAMMLPTALPAVRHVAVNSLYWRRRRAVLEFLAVYLGIWAIFSAIVLGVLTSWPAANPTAVLAFILALAALWQLTPVKRRALRACHLPRALPPKGWRATAGVANFGLRNGGACLASCWAMMLTMAVVSSARLTWMALLTGLIMVEKLSLKPGRTARRIGILFGTAAIGAAVLVTVG